MMVAKEKPGARFRVSSLATTRLGVKHPVGRIRG
jgi:hypothetical protein